MQLQLELEFSLEEYPVYMSISWNYGGMIYMQK